MLSLLQRRSKRALPKGRDDDGVDVGVDGLTAEGKKRLASADNRVRLCKEVMDMLPEAVSVFRVASAADAAHAEDCFAIWASQLYGNSTDPAKWLHYDYDATYAGDTALKEALQRITTTAEMVAYVQERYKRATRSRGKRAKTSSSAAAADNSVAAEQDGSQGGMLATEGAQAAAGPKLGLQSATLAAELQKGAAAVASTASLPYQQLMQLMPWRHLAVPSPHSQAAATARLLQQQQLSAEYANIVAAQQAASAALAAPPAASAAAAPPSQGGAVPTFPLPLLPLPPPAALVPLQPLPSHSGAVAITSDLPGLKANADAAAAVQKATQGRSLTTKAVALLLDKADELGLPRSEKVPPNPKRELFDLICFLLISL